MRSVADSLISPRASGPEEPAASSSPYVRCWPARLRAKQDESAERNTGGQGTTPGAGCSAVRGASGQAPTQRPRGSGSGGSEAPPIKHNCRRLGGRLGTLSKADVGGNSRQAEAVSVRNPSCRPTSMACRPA